MEDVFFDYPGSISTFTFNESVEDSAIRSWASGTGQGNEKIAQMRYSSSRANEGYLLTERVESYGDVEQPSILYGLATTDLERSKTPNPQWTFEVAGWEYPRFMTPLGSQGAWRVGDWARFVIRDPFFAGAYADYRGILPVTARIVGYTVTLQDEVNEDPSELISLELEGADFEV
jgi:hypothetical protein